MQTSREKISLPTSKHLEKRIQYNACKVYVSQLASGETYPKLNQVIGITVLDFSMFRDFDHYLSCHEFKEKVTGNCYLDAIRHYFIELPKFTKTENELETPIEKWCYFIKNAGKLQMIPEKLNSAPYVKAFELANRANMTKDEWEAFDATAVWIQDQRGAASAARKEALQEGILKVARALRKEKVDPHTSAKSTGLSLEEIEKL